MAKAQHATAAAEHLKQQDLLHAYGLEPGGSSLLSSHQQQGGSHNSSHSMRGTGMSASSQVGGCNPVRIVGMSATLPNAEEVSWALPHLEVQCIKHVAST